MTIEDSAKLVVVSGAGGGAAPHWVKLAGRFSSEGMLPLDALAGELVAMLMLAAVGAWVVVAFKEKTMLKAFVLGVSAPAFVINLTSTVAQARPLPQHSDSVRTEIMLMERWATTPLYALGQSIPRQERKLTITTQVPISGSIVIRDVVSRTEREIAADPDGGWTVPTNEFRVLFRGVRDKDRVPVETPDSVFVEGGEQTVVLQLHMSDPEQTFWGGFLDGLGFDSWAQRLVRAEATIEVSSK